MGHEFTGNGLKIHHLSCKMSVDWIFQATFDSIIVLFTCASRDGSSPSRGAAETAEPWPEPCFVSHCGGHCFVSKGNQRPLDLGYLDTFKSGWVACLWIQWLLECWFWSSLSLQWCHIADFQLCAMGPVHHNLCSIWPVQWPCFLWREIWKVQSCIATLSMFL